MTPKRIQRSRKKGSRLISPNGLPIVYVGRGSKWGNPYTFGRPENGTHDCQSREKAIERFKHQIELEKAGNVTNLSIRFSHADVVNELRGKNLACWCNESTPCHADILLEIANNKGE